MPKSGKVRELPMGLSRIGWCAGALQWRHAGNAGCLASDDGDRLEWDIEDAEFVAAARKQLAVWDASHDKSKDVSRSNPVLTQS